VHIDAEIRGHAFTPVTEDFVKASPLISSYNIY